MSPERREVQSQGPGMKALLTCVAVDHIFARDDHAEVHDACLCDLWVESQINHPSVELGSGFITEGCYASERAEQVTGICVPSSLNGVLNLSRVPL